MLPNFPCCFRRFMVEIVFVGSWLKIVRSNGVIVMVEWQRWLHEILSMVHCSPLYLGTLKLQQTLIDISSQIRYSS